MKISFLTLFKWFLFRHYVLLWKLKWSNLKKIIFNNFFLISSFVFIDKIIFCKSSKSKKTKQENIFLATRSYYLCTLDCFRIFSHFYIFSYFSYFRTFSYFRIFRYFSIFYSFKIELLDRYMRQVYSFHIKAIWFNFIELCRLLEILKLVYKNIINAFDKDITENVWQYASHCILIQLILF